MITLISKPPPPWLSVKLKFLTPVTLPTFTALVSVNVTLPEDETVSPPVLRFKGPISPEPAIRLTDPAPVATLPPMLAVMVPDPDTVRLTLFPPKMGACIARLLAVIVRSAGLAVTPDVKVTAPVLLSVKEEPSEAPFPIIA